MSALGKYLKEKRTEFQKKHSGYSLRAVAKRIGIHHSYLSKLERGEQTALSTDRIIALARDYSVDEDYLLALGGKVSERFAMMIYEHPEVFQDFITHLEGASGKASDDDSYVGRLKHRKMELETMTRLLRDEIKKRQHLEHDLKKAEAEKHTILKNLKDVVVEYIDSDLNILWASPNAEDVFGCNPQEVIGKKCYKALKGRDAPCPECPAVTTIASNTIQEGTMTTKEGSRWVTRSVPILDALGEVDKVVMYAFNVSEILEAREALEKSEIQLRSILTDIPALVCRFSEDGTIQYVNESYSSYFDTTSDELVGTSFLDLIPAKDQSVVWEQFTSLTVEAPVTTYSHRVEAPNGEIRWQRWTDRAIFSADGQVEIYQSVGQDVTDIHYIQERQRLLASVIENTTSVCVIKNLNLQIIATNQAYADAVGFSCAEELLGKTDEEVFKDSPNAAKVKGWISDEFEVQTYRRGHNLDRKEEFVFPDGSVHIFHVRQFPIFNDSDELIATATIAIDVTDEVEAKKAALLIEKQFADLVANAPIGICRVAKSGEYLSINKKHAENFGYASPEEMRDSNSTARNVFIRREAWEQLTRQLDRDDIVLGFDAQTRRSDGSVFWTSRTVRAVRDDSGEVSYYEAFVEDVQDRKVAEQLANRTRDDFLAILEQAEVGMYVCDPETNTIVFANDYLKEELGLELLGEHASIVLKDTSEEGLTCFPSNQTLSSEQTITRTVEFSNGKEYFCKAKVLHWGDTESAVCVVALDASSSMCEGDVRS